MLRCTAVVFAICSLAIPAAADSSLSALAAPGDCAKPSVDYETPPLYEQTAGVPGPAVDHFVPNRVSGVLGALPVDLTRAAATVGDVAAGSTTLVEGTAESAVGASTAIGETGNAIGLEGLGGTASGTLDRATDAVDLLTDTAKSALGGRK